LFGFCSLKKILIIYSLIDLASNDWSNFWMGHFFPPEINPSLSEQQGKGGPTTFQAQVIVSYRPLFRFSFLGLRGEDNKPG
jgi:hypothetical protein